MNIFKIIGSKMDYSTYDKDKKYIEDHQEIYSIVKGLDELHKDTLLNSQILQLSSKIEAIYEFYIHDIEDCIYELKMVDKIENLDSLYKKYIRNQIYWNPVTLTDKINERIEADIMFCDELGDRKVAVVEGDIIRGMVKPEYIEMENTINRVNNYEKKMKSKKQ